MNEQKYAIDDALEIMAGEGRMHFSPLYVCERSGVSDIKTVTEHMFSLVDYQLKVYFEVECPEGDSDFAVTDPSSLNKELRVCSICGTSYIPSADRIWIAFDFLPEYVANVKKKQKAPFSPSLYQSSMLAV